MLQQQRLELLAPLNEHLERASLDPQAEVERQTFQVDTVAWQEFHVRVIDEADTVEVDDAQVGSVRFDLADIDHFIDLFRLLVRQLKRSCIVVVFNVFIASVNVRNNYAYACLYDVTTNTQRVRYICSM